MACGYHEIRPPSLRLRMLPPETLAKNCQEYTVEKRKEKELPKAEGIFYTQYRCTCKAFLFQNAKLDAILWKPRSHQRKHEKTVLINLLQKQQKTRIMCIIRCLQKRSKQTNRENYTGINKPINQLNNQPTRTPPHRPLEEHPRHVTAFGAFSVCTQSCLSASHVFTARSRDALNTVVRPPAPSGPASPVTA